MKKKTVRQPNTSRAKKGSVSDLPPQADPKGGITFVYGKVIPQIHSADVQLPKSLKGHE